MSKASEWADACARAEAARQAIRVEARLPETWGKWWDFDYLGVHARVTQHGDLEIADGKLIGVIQAKDALPFAHWIIATFGEPTP